MSEGSNTATPPGDKRHVGGELIIPIAGLLFTIYYFSTIVDSPWIAQVSAFFIGSILIALIIGYLIKTVLEVKSGAADFRPGPLNDPVELMPKRMILFALTVGYIFVIYYLGFTLTTFLFLAGAMALLADRKRLGFIIGLSAVFSLAGWALFILAFDTRFPVGPFERFMDGMF
jgi:hypothetical protein